MPLDLGREDAIRRSAAARAATAPTANSAPSAPAASRDPGETPPRSFEELLAGAGAKATVCARCSQTATLTVQLAVRPMRKTKSGMPPHIASHNAKLCEPCAVEIFAAYRESTR